MFIKVEACLLVSLSPLLGQFPVWLWLTLRHSLSFIFHLFLASFWMWEVVQRHLWTRLITSGISPYNEVNKVNVQGYHNNLLKRSDVRDISSSIYGTNFKSPRIAHRLFLLRMWLLHGPHSQWFMTLKLPEFSFLKHAARQFLPPWRHHPVYITRDVISA